MSDGYTFPYCDAHGYHSGDSCPRCANNEISYEAMPQLPKPTGLATAFDIEDIKSTKKQGRGKKVTIDNIEFDSITESNRYIYLRQLQAENIISNLMRPTSCELRSQLVVMNNAIHPSFKQAREVYTPDFSYQWQGHLIVEDVKPHDTKAYKKNKKVVPYVDSSARNKHKQYMRIIYAKPSRVFLLTVWNKTKWLYFYNGKKELIDFSLE